MIENSKLWLGVVENINDPEMRGRIKVRVCSIHDVFSNADTQPNEQTGKGLPTEDLPWAMCVFPVTYSGTVPAPQLRIGHIVVGVALDDFFQELLVIGRLSNVLNATSMNAFKSNVTNSTSNSNTKNSTTEQNINVAFANLKEKFS